MVQFKRMSEVPRSKEDGLNRWSRESDDSSHTAAVNCFGPTLPRMGVSKERTKATVGRAEKERRGKLHIRFTAVIG